MTWTAPKLWANEPLTAADMNTYISDNLDALKDPPSGIYNAVEGTDLALNSTSWADVHATDGKFQHTITTNGGAVMVMLNATLSTAAAAVLYLDVAVDGIDYGVTTLGAADGLHAARVEATATAVDGQVTFIRFLEGIAAGAHTFKLRYKVNTSTVTIYRAAGTANADIPAQFVVREAS
jgi:hypothetical protein